MGLKKVRWGYCIFQSFAILLCAQAAISSDGDWQKTGRDAAFAYFPYFQITFAYLPYLQLDTAYCPARHQHFEEIFPVECHRGDWQNTTS